MAETPEITSTWYHARLIRAAFPAEARRACVPVALLSVAIVIACGGAPTHRAAPAPPPARTAPPLEPWPPFTEMMKLEPVTPVPYRTQGHLGVPPFLVTRVSPAARDTYLSLVTDSTLPADAVVAATHQEEGGESPGPTYVMERRGGAWRYLVIDQRGFILRGARQECAGCHAGGVAERLFGPPRPKAPPAAPRE